jgi:Ca-activated chloride channel homolog
MRFDNPQILFLLPLAAILLTLFHLWAGARKRRLMAQFAQPALLQKLTRGVSIGRQRWKTVLTALAILLALFCLARPQYGTVERPLQRKGIEVIVALDCSQSMLAQDIKPSRFDRAKEELRNLIQRLQGESVGVIAFAGVSIVQCPLTSDRAMAMNLLDSMTLDSVPVQGTDLAKAIDQARGMYHTASAGNKVLVLLTDGENLDGEPLKSAEEAAKEGVRIYCIGIGSPEGAPIPIKAGGYKEAKDGKVNTRLDFDSLTKIASTTGGKAILSNPSGQEEAKAIAADLAALKQGDLQEKTLTIHQERFQIFLIPAVLLLLLEMLLSDRRRKTRQAAGRFD